MGAINSCRSKITYSGKLFVLDQQQYDLTKSIADTIVPRTDTPSASDVNVPLILDLLLRDTFNDDTKQEFLNGLVQFDSDCKNATDHTFMEHDPKSRYDYLDKIDQLVMAEKYNDKVPFYYAFKKLVITIYFSSEQAIKDNLNYQPVPGPFQGDIRLESESKIMVGNDI